MSTNKFFVIALMLLSTTMASCGPKKDYLVTIKTSFGDITLILFDDTPKHKQNFLDLAREGRYDSTIFHRVMPEFMIQGGDVNAREGVVPTSADLIPAEILENHFHIKGAVAAARNNNPEKKSSDCQFYIVLGKTFSEAELTLDRMLVNQYFGKYLALPQCQDLRNEVVALQQTQDFEALEAKMLEVKPLIEKEFEVSLVKEISPERVQAYTTVGGSPHLDDEYTVFGQVLAGLEVVDAITAQKTGPRDRPLDDIIMTVEIEQLKRKQITKKYGYQYPDSE